MNLFDTRGGSLQAHVCEVCNEEIDVESRYPTCPDCTGEVDHD